MTREEQLTHRAIQAIPGRLDKLIQQLEALTAVLAQQRDSRDRENPHPTEV
jgi:hypothetical protein